MTNYRSIIRAELANNSNKKEYKRNLDKFTSKSSSAWDEAVDAQPSYVEQEEDFFSSVEDDEDMECVFFS